jgi:hypothetical protein
VRAKATDDMIDNTASGIHASRSERFKESLNIRLNLCSLKTQRRRPLSHLMSEHRIRIDLHMDAELR